MTRVEIFQTIARLGYQVEGTATNKIRVYRPGGSARDMSEAEALDFLAQKSVTHCLSCGQKLPPQKEPSWNG